MLKFNLNWRLTIFTAAFLPLLIGLGFWQLNRAEEKRIILQQWQQQQILAPKKLLGVTKQQLEKHQKVSFVATFAEEKYWLLEARMHQGQPGYEVLMPARLTSGEWLLINRGWLRANPDRRNLPFVESPKMQIEMWGEVREPPEAALVDERDNPLQSWPHRVLEADIALMSQQFDEHLAPFIVALDADHPSAFVVESKPVNMPPEKHIGYATQWFAMATVLSILWLLSNTNILSLMGMNSTKNKNGET